MPEENARQSAITKLDSIDSSVFRLKHDVYAKLMKSNRNKGSSRSSHFSRTHSLKSAKSTSSMEHKARTAALKTEADVLRRGIAGKVQAEAKKNEVEIDTDLAWMDKEIAKSEAIDKVYEKGESAK